MFGRGIIRGDVSTSKHTPLPRAYITYDAVEKGRICSCVCVCGCMSVCSLLTDFVIASEREAMFSVSADPFKADRSFLLDPK